jgi:hypothetical protein
MSKQFYAIKPEVAGGAGPNTVFIDPRARPPLIEKFNYEFYGWLGDPILVTVCTFIVTEPVRDSLLAINATGVSFAHVEVSKSGEFQDLYPGRNLPPFVWMQVTGRSGDDLSYTSDHALVVSESVLDILLKCGMSYGKFVELERWKGRRNSDLRTRK